MNDRLRPFMNAKVGDEAYTYETEPDHMDEFGWVTDLVWFDERYGEIKLTRKRWQLIEVDEIVLPDPYPMEDEDDEQEDADHDL